MRKFYFLWALFFFAVKAQSALVMDYRIVDGQLLLRWTTTHVSIAPMQSLKGFELVVEGEQKSNRTKIFPDTLNPLVKRWNSLNLAEEEKNMFGALYLLQCDTDTSFARTAGWMYTLPFRKNRIKKIMLRSLFNGDSTLVQIDEAPKFSLAEPVEPEIKCRNGIVRISFDVPHKEYSHYEIWRKKQQGKWEKINPHPLVQLRRKEDKEMLPMVFYDTLQPNEKAEYKYCGRTPFGERGPFSKTAAIIAYPDFSAFPEPVIDSLQKNYTCINIAWSSEKDKALCSSILLWVSLDGRQKTSLSFQNKTFSKLELPYRYGKGQRYFHVAYVHLNGDTLFADPLLHFVPDTEPPQIPQNLQGKVDTSGKVFLSWNPPPDKDLRGYRLFCRNTKAEEWTQISRQWIRDTCYVDSVSLKFLSKEKQYAISCSDSAFNSSTYSDAITIQLPDIIAPPVPVIKNLFHRADTLFLSWHAYDEGKPCKVLLRITHRDSLISRMVYSADTVITGLSGFCKINICALDASGNASASETIAIEMPELKAISFRLQARFISEKAVHALSIQYPDAEIFRVDVLRKTDAGLWENLESFSGNVTGEVLCKVKPGHRYRYMVVLVLTDGRKIKIESEDLLT